MEFMNGSEQHFQHTINEELVISGAGIHTGQSVTMRLKPAEPNTGINFQRVDLPEKTVVKADGYMKMKRYQEAKTAYEEALTFKANDVYATNKLIELEKLMIKK